MGRTLAVVVAHPDDESYSTYGTVARYADEWDVPLHAFATPEGVEFFS